MTGDDDGGDDNARSCWLLLLLFLVTCFFLSSRASDKELSGCVFLLEQKRTPRMEIFRRRVKGEARQRSVSFQSSDSCAARISDRRGQGRLGEEICCPLEEGGR